MRSDVEATAATRASSGKRADPIRVAWLGGRPEWLDLPEASAQLARADHVEEERLDRVLVSRLRAGHPGAQSVDVVHVTSDALRAVGGCRDRHPAAAIVADLTQQTTPFGRTDARRAADADLVLLGSRMMLREVRRRHPFLTPRTALFRCPLDLDAHAPADRLARTRPADVARFVDRALRAGRMLVYAAPVVETGGLDLAIEALGRIDERNGAHLVVLPLEQADLRYLQRCERRAERLGVPISVNHLAQGEMPLWFAFADVVCTPFREPLSPQGARLAAAAGRPLLGSEVEPLLETVEEGKTGWLVPVDDVEALADRLRALLTRDDLGRRVGRQARLRAERELSPARAASQLVALWETARRRRAEALAPS